MPLSTTLPSLLSTLQADNLAVAQAMIDLTLVSFAAQEDANRMRNVLASPWVMRIVFVSECLTELSAALKNGSLEAAQQVAEAHRRLIEASEFRGQLPTIPGLRAVADRQLQIERRYTWLCQALTQAPASAQYAA